MSKCVWLACAAAAMLIAGPARADDGPKGVFHKRIIGAPGGPFQVLAFQAEDEENEHGHAGQGVAMMSEYWLGLECRPAEGALRSQLKLPKGQGLVVEELLPEGPAAKAGLKQHDVLVKAGDQPLGQVNDLVKAIEKAKETKLTLQIVREGKPTKLDVIPAKREAGVRVPPPFGPVPVPGNPDLEKALKWLEKMQPGAEGRPNMQFRFLQPGMILPPGAPLQAPLPEGMSVSIGRSGKEPAKIVVEKGGKRWEATEKDLDKLPQEVRPHVERMLGRLPFGADFDVEVARDHAIPAPPARAMPPGAVLPGPAQPDKLLHERLEKMSRQIDELRKAVEDLKGKAPKSEPPKKHAEK